MYIVLITVWVSRAERYMFVHILTKRAVPYKSKATDAAGVTKKTKHQITVAMAKKWQMQYNQEYQSLAGLKVYVQCR